MDDLQYQIDLLTAMNERLMNSEKIYRHIAEYSGNLYLYFDLKDTHKVELIGPWDEFMGERIINHPYDESYMISQICEEDQDLLRRRILEIERLGLDSDTLEVRTKTHKYWLSCEARVTYDSEHNPVEKLISVRDITKLKSNNEEIMYLAYYDSLTGLYNRNYFVSKLRDMIDMAKEADCSVETLFIDIDDFKKINDSIGLLLGDELVQSFGQFIKEFESEDVIVGRFGSDVFIIGIYNPSGQRSADVIYRKIRERLRKPFKLTNSTEICFTVSAGVAEYPDAGKSALDVIKNAEIVLYKAKEKGKNTVAFFEQDLLKNFLKNVSIENQMKDAISNEEFVLYFQPQFDVRTGVLRGAEALLRWPDKKGGFTSNPSDFIPIAEKNGSINELGNWVLNDAVRTINDWRMKYHIPIVLSVNISALQIEKDNFVDSIQRLIQMYGINPEYFEIEITESVLINNVDDVADKINTLRGMGVKVSLDDFGTGYCSLSYIRKLPIDTLKIDKLFIDTAISDSSSALIYEAVVNLAKKLGFETIAEGVETEEQFEFLQSIDCNTIQGFLLGKPMNREDFEKLLIRQLP